MASKYLGQAQKELEGQYSAKIQGLKNTLATQLANLEALKTGVNQNYDTQVKNQNLQNTLSKNNYSNTMLGRGLGRSSIVTSGLAGMDDKNNRIIGEINTNRNNSLSNIDMQKSTMQNNTESMINQLVGEKQSAIYALARQLENEAWERNYRMRQLNASRSNYGSTSPNIKAGSAYSSALTTLNGFMNSYSPANVLEIQEIMDYFGNDTTKEGKYVMQMAQQALQRQQEMQRSIQSTRKPYSTQPTYWGQSSPPKGIDDADTITGAAPKAPKKKTSGISQFFKALTSRF